MSSSIERLNAIAEQLSDGREPDPVPVRMLLSWFSAQRRGSNVVWWIRRELKRAGLATEPDFESSWIDAQVRFVAAPDDAGGEAEGEAADASGSVETDAAEALDRGLADAAYRISKLESANIRPTCVPPDVPLDVAVGLMLSNDFSQLPVMHDQRTVKGMISWTAIGKRLSLGRPVALVRDCMTEYASEIAADASLFAAIDSIIRNEYVLVRGKDQTVTGIVTTADLSRQFLLLAEPFLLLGEIENRIRRMIDVKFSKSQLETVRDPSTEDRSIETAADFQFGEYVRLLENPENWHQLGLGIDRKVFVDRLDRVRAIRNDVMHFDPDGTPPNDIVLLRSFLKMLQELAAFGAV